MSQKQYILVTIQVSDNGNENYLFQRTDITDDFIKKLETQTGNEEDDYIFDLIRSKHKKKKIKFPAPVNIIKQSDCYQGYLMC
jgi:hypothetical protein